MSEENIFREVDEELRSDRMRGAWRRFGPYVIGAGVLIVLIVAANEGWSWWQNSNAARSSDQFYAALDIENGGDIAGAQAAMNKLAATGSGSYPVLAKFKAAGLLGRQGKNDEALAAYDALATSESNSHLRGLALVLAANLAVDKGDVAAVNSRVAGLVTPDNPLRNAALEAIGLTQYKAKDFNSAAKSFQTVMDDPGAPQDTRGRMQLFIAQLVAEGATPPAAAIVDASVTTPAGAADAAVPAAKAVAGTDSAATPAPALPTPVAAQPAGATPAPPASRTTTTPAADATQPLTPDPAMELATPNQSAVTPADSANPAATGAGGSASSSPAAAGDATQVPDAAMQLATPNQAPAANDNTTTPAAGATTTK